MMESTPATSVPHPLTLHGSVVRLEPLQPGHVDALMGISRASPGEFMLTNTPVTDEERDAYFGSVLAQRDAGSAYPFTIFLQTSGEIVGSTRFSAMDWTHRNTQLGYTWFRTDQHGTAANLDAKLLMLTCAFEQLQLHRVAIRTDVRNERSRRAILGLGAKEEGVLRRHMITRTGSIRDTVVYSIIDLEWPETKALITERIERRLERLSGSRAGSRPGPRDH